MSQAPFFDTLRGSLRCASLSLQLNCGGASKKLIEWADANKMQRALEVLAKNSAREEPDADGAARAGLTDADGGGSAQEMLNFNLSRREIPVQSGIRFDRLGLNPYPLSFKQMAMERMKDCASVSGLANELVSIAPCCITGSGS